ncbi:hypothetical protein [Frigoriglobus tundricola]|uniref:Uncharacterized protein n=1 Tax=Frigoriglobus tundricola TaxID=2774151 RepID=A0A6M5YMR6_9BACT|nr:hypothetical protein [Frigoriglobus tundricola]QJW94636.1 hypothetical protein FTUN_2158 [Frigoriglobus tundricola]
MSVPVSFEQPPHMSGGHRHTYDEIFRHPTAHNLEWHDVRSLLDALADVTEKHDGALEVTRNGRVLILHPPKHKDAPVEMVLEIRRFLERPGAGAVPTAVIPGLDLLVVIDHHEAKVYRTEAPGSAPQNLVPYDPHGFRRHLHSQTEETDGKRKPERKSYYETVAATLRGADRILIFGSGTGGSSAMDQLVADLKAHHPDVAARVVASVVVDAHHTTEPQLLAEARAVFARPDGQNPPATEGAS